MNTYSYNSIEQPDFLERGELDTIYEDATAYGSQNPEMEQAWQFVSSTNVSVFLTGKAGTGKTTFLKRLRQTMPKRMVVLASTGVAAINAGGQTIHSFFQISFGPFIPGSVSKEQNSYRMSDKKKALIRSLDLLVIDEISMVRADLLDAVDDALRRYRDRTKPFGGVQLLLIGDLMQLSPVTKPDEWALLSSIYQTPYFFSSHALAQLRYVTIELKHIYRQQDQHFVDLLGMVRHGHITPEVTQAFNQRYVPGFEPQEPGWIRLTTHNAPANQYNESRLAQLNAIPHSYHAEVKGEFPEYSYPNDELLTLKVGAQVMFVKNDPTPEHRYYNGKIGVVTEIGDQGVTVKCQDDNSTIEVEPVVWENTKYTLDNETKEVKEQVVGTFTQIPLRLAWAITVHKSQGLTFDRAILDINASFAHGQVYVALSRCRTLEGIVLSAPLMLHSVITDINVNQFISTSTEAATHNAEMLDSYKVDYVQTLLDELYSFQSLENALQWLTRVVDEYLSSQYPWLLNELKEAAVPVNALLTNVAARFRPQYTTFLQQYGGNIAGSSMADRIRESSRYFQAKIAEIFDTLLKDAVIAINNKQIAERYNNALATLKTEVSQKSRLFDAMKSVAFTVTNYLSAKAKLMLDDELQKPRVVRTIKAKKEKENKAKTPKEPKVKTELQTLTLFRQGFTPAQIAEKRGLVISTIYTHLEKLIAQDAVTYDEVINKEKELMILQAIATFTEAFTIADVHRLLPEDITYSEIRLVQSRNK